MLHTKFRENRPAGVLEKKIFEGVLPYMAIAAILVFDLDHVNKFSFPCT